MCPRCAVSAVCMHYMHGGQRNWRAKTRRREKWAEPGRSRVCGCGVTMRPECHSIQHNSVIGAVGPGLSSWQAKGWGLVVVGGGMRPLQGGPHAWPAASALCRLTPLPPSHAPGPERFSHSPPHPSRLAGLGGYLIGVVVVLYTAYTTFAEDHTQLVTGASDKLKVTLPPPAQCAPHPHADRLPCPHLHTCLPSTPTPRTHAHKQVRTHVPGARGAGGGGHAVQVVCMNILHMHIAFPLLRLLFRWYWNTVTNPWPSRLVR